MLVSIFVAFAAAILSGLGIGSAGLFVLWLTFVLHVPQIVAQGTNLIFFLFSSGAALAVHDFRTPLLWKTILCLALFGLYSSVLGVRTATELPQELLRTLFGVLLILTGIIGLFGRRK